MLSYLLPINMTEELPVISTQPTNSSLSELVKDATGQWTYRYKAKDGFVGIDKVVVDSEAEDHGKKGSGRCGNHDDDEDEGYRLILNINSQAIDAEPIKK